MSALRWYKSRIQAAVLDAVYSRPIRRAGPGRDVIFIPASNFGSLGDLAMIEGLHNLVAPENARRVHLCEYGPADHWETSFPVASRLQLPSGFFAWLSWRKNVSKFEHIFLNGADVLDGKYSVPRTLARLAAIHSAATLGIPSTITGFSFNRQPDQRILHAFRKLPDSVRLCLRDPHSLENFERITGRRGIQTADLAFLVQAQNPEGPASEVLHQIASARSKGFNVVALTPNIHAVQGVGAATKKKNIVTNFFAQLITEWRRERPETLFVLVPHDTRGEYSDVALCRDIKNANSEICEELGMPRDPLTPAQIKGLLREVDILVTGRMHCGIAALGVAVPTIFLDYQDKVRGLEIFFEDSFKITLAAEYHTAVAQSASLMERFLRDLPQRRLKLELRLPVIKDLARKNSPFTEPAEKGAVNAPLTSL